MLTIISDVFVWKTDCRWHVWFRSARGASKMILETKFPFFVTGINGILINSCRDSISSAKSRMAFRTFVLCRMSLYWNKRAACTFSVSAVDRVVIEQRNGLWVEDKQQDLSVLEILLYLALVAWLTRTRSPILNGSDTIFFTYIMPGVVVLSAFSNKGADFPVHRTMRALQIRHVQGLDRASKCNGYWFQMRPEGDSTVDTFRFCNMPAMTRSTVRTVIESCQHYSQIVENKTHE